MRAPPDIIAAIGTAHGRAAIGIVRVSGANLRPFIAKIVERDVPPRAAVKTAFVDSGGAAIDEGLALFFPAPSSYTGEDVFELQGHGGPIVQRLLLERCVELGARLAEPGEFTKRAFLNGKLDLAQAESVIDLIDAATSQAARSAVRSLQGEFSARINVAAAALTELRAHTEAVLDFPEEDIEPADREGIAQRLRSVTEEVQRILDAARQGSLLRDGLQVVLAGAPNVGKSSLLNQLSGADRAIVTDVPGTTRDLIREVIDIEGVPIQVIDTAGLRECVDPVERIGVDRARAAIDNADVVIALYDAALPCPLSEADPLRGAAAGVPRLNVMNKIDLSGHAPTVERGSSGAMLWISAKTGAGVDLLRREICRVAGWEGHAEGTYLARERHLSALRAAREHLTRAAEEAGRLEFFAEELRLAHTAVMVITGTFSVEDLLGEIFSRFCIGK